MKDDRNYHQRLQEFCDCYMETDPKTELEKGSQKVLQQEILLHLDNFIGQAFDGICREILRHLATVGRIKLDYDSAGRWWNGNEEIGDCGHKGGSPRPCRRMQMVTKTDWHEWPAGTSEKSLPPPTSGRTKAWRFCSGTERACPKCGTGPFCYQLGMKKRNAIEVMIQ